MRRKKTRPTMKIKNLASDVFYDFARRCSEFEEELAPPEAAPATSPGSTYDDYPPPDFPCNGRACEDRHNDSGYGGGTPGVGRCSSEDNGRRSADACGGGTSSQGTTGLRLRPSESVMIQRAHAARRAPLRECA
ncbi:hypothetical protein C2E23DRAFT_853665 [Lenzites betulinus]|nr:hypothetical protein C2E23DRAFT_853665 [Lenzites betulinus]